MIHEQNLDEASAPFYSLAQLLYQVECLDIVSLGTCNQNGKSYGDMIIDNHDVAKFINMHLGFEGDEKRRGDVVTNYRRVVNNDDWRHFLSWQNKLQSFVRTDLITRRLLQQDICMNPSALADAVKNEALSTTSLRSLRADSFYRNRSSTISPSPPRLTPLSMPMHSRRTQSCAPLRVSNIKCKNSVNSSNQYYTYEGGFLFSNPFNASLPPDAMRLALSEVCPVQRSAFDDLPSIFRTDIHYIAQENGTVPSASDLFYYFRFPEAVPERGCKTAENPVPVDLLTNTQSYGVRIHDFCTTEDVPGKWIYLSFSETPISTNIVLRGVEYPTLSNDEHPNEQKCEKKSTEAFPMRFARIDELDGKLALNSDGTLCSDVFQSTNHRHIIGMQQASTRACNFLLFIWISNETFLEVLDGSSIMTKKGVDTLSYLSINGSAVSNPPSPPPRRDPLVKGNILFSFAALVACLCIVFC